MPDLNIIVLYSFTLTGAPDGVDDIVIPIESFQARKRSGDPTYLSLVIPGTEYATEIAARLNGEMVINMVKLLDGAAYQDEEILRANLETVRIDEGGVNQSITLTGHKQKTYTPKTVALENVSYFSTNNGKITCRCAVPDIYLNSGDTATYDGNSFTVGLITYTVNVTDQSMEVSEVDA